MTARAFGSQFALVAMLCTLCMFFFPAAHGPYSAVHGPVTALQAARSALRMLLTIAAAAFGIMNGHFQLNRSFPSSDYQSLNGCLAPIESTAILRC